MNISKLASDQGLTPEEFIDILEVFIDISKKDIAAIHAALDTKDADMAIHAAHSIKGAAGNLGFIDIFDSALAAETCARSGDLSKMKESVSQLEQQFEQVIVYYEEIHNGGQ